MNRRAKLARKIMSAALSLAIVLPASLALIGSSADALVSLPYIERLKQQGGAFKILEILPNETQGSVGYYISGQEPCADWAQRAALARNAASPEERKSYVDKLFEDLTAAGVMGTGTGTPLKQTANYSERFPWQEHEGFIRMELDHEETKKNVKGDFIVAEDGAYIFTGTYKVVGNGPYVQIVDHFTTTPEGDEADYFWYEPIFTPVLNGASLGPGTAVYKNTATFDNSAAEPIYNGYVYIGTVGKPGFTEMEIGHSYYIVTDTKKPSDKRNDNGNNRNIYAAISGGFIPTQDGKGGYFKPDKQEYAYVGAGGGYNFSSDGNNKYDIKYGTVFYEGGFTNNDWFLRYVFDWEDDEARPQITLKVSSAAAGSVTQSQIDSASMIIISGGFVPNGSAEPYSTANDLAGSAGGTAYNAIISACKPTGTDAVGKPVVVDKSLTGGTLNVNALALQLTENKTTEHVKKNVYCAAYPLVTDKFNTLFKEAAYKAAGAPFYEVRRQIDYENFLRGTDTEHLPMIVSMASTIRYIISGARSLTIKSTIKVLELQPGKSGEISEADVRAWLQADDSLGVDIKTMSTSEFIGKIEDIAEIYDLVYIGSCIDDFSTAYEKRELITSYNDPDLNGLVYTNIGDTVQSGGKSGFSLSGLLDRDYSEETFNHKGTSYNALHTGYIPFNLAELTRTFRFSGNDITAQKLRELHAYASSGYPVVLANDLYASLSIGEKLPDGSPWSFHPGDCDWGSFSDCKYNIRLEPDNKNLTLSAYLTKADIGAWEISDVKVASFTWYRYVDGINDVPVQIEKEVNISSYGKVESTLDLTENKDIADNALQEGQFYCEAKAIKVSSLYLPARNVTPARSRLATLTSGTNAGRVDNSSKMFELLKAFDGRSNVISVWQTHFEENREFLNKCANLSKPEIVFSETDGKKAIPEPYTGLNGVSLAPLDPGDPSSGYELRFRFTLENDSDPVVSDYTCKLLIDANGDGRFREGEHLTDAVVREWNSVTGKAGNRISASALQIGREYLVSRRMPSDMVGIIPWRLEIFKTSAARVHCSENGYTHIQPQPEQLETINILQINTQDNLAGVGLNLETNLTFQGLFDEVSGEFIVNVMTVGASKLDSLLADYNKYLINPGLTAQGNDSEALVVYLRAMKDKGVEFSDLQELLNSFNMLVLGFGDSYRGISGNSAKAIAGFIKTGKAALFSHDCSSYYYLPFKEYETENEGNILRMPDFVYSKDNIAALASFTMFGYEFNMAIRDAVGLDRYGVTNPVFGVSRFAPDWLKTGIADNPDTDENESVARIGIVPSADYTIEKLSENTSIKGKTQTLLKHLEDGGYSIAYKPNSAKSKTVPETQGLSSGILMRFYKGGGRPTIYDSPPANEDSELVSQVNEGQITTYPFDLNTADFSGTNTSVTQAGTNKMSISPTHCQYQQLNMNSDDIVVWYCLAGGHFDNTPNDAVNSYYLYSRGNVTYTGFGHTTKTVDANEAKLLVNTMVAAYRSRQNGPGIRFTDETGINDLDSFLIPSDNGEIITAAASKDKNRRIFFTVYDTNYADQKKISVSFTYGAENVTLGAVAVYDAQLESAVAPTQSLVSGVTYYILLDDVLSCLGSNAAQLIGSTGLTLTATVKSIIGSSDRVSTDTISLRKLDLFNLS